MALLVVGIGAVTPNRAAAQSAADKTTARQLATDGIQLFRQDRFADALDKLERAESLFDAPVHLLYIARCQAKLNHLVEAAETYRRLVRVELSAQAPQTFKDAVADGQKELPNIEPKVPLLRVEVVPANAKDLRLSIDGESVSTAVIGVDRPINPGSHVVEVSTKGQAPVSRRVDVAASSKQVVKLELAVAPSGAGPAAPMARGEGTSAEATGPGESPSAGTSSKVDGGPTNLATPAPDESGRLTIVAGLDFAGALPLSGKLDAQNNVQTGTGVADDRSLRGRYGPGVGLELRAGLGIPVARLALTPLLFFNFHSHTPGSLYKTSADRAYGLPNDVDSVMTANPTSIAIGLGLRMDTARLIPKGLAIFGELGFIARQAYATTGKWEIAQSGGKCEFTEDFNGLGLRARAGAIVRVWRFISVVGAAGVTVARISSAGLTDKTCEPSGLESAFGVAPKASVPSDNRRYHAVLGLTLGAEFGFGLGK